MIMVACVSLVMAGFIGFGIASAGGATTDEGAFGLDGTMAASAAQDRAIVVSGSSAATDDSILTNTSQRDISPTVQAIAITITM